MNSVQSAVVMPAPVLLPHGKPGRTTVGQSVPNTGIFRLTEDHILHLSKWVAPRRTSAATLRP